MPTEAGSLKVLEKEGTIDGEGWLYSGPAPTQHSASFSEVVGNDGVIQ